ncbi:MAG: hypothetical protein DRH03_10100, partial [Deltaproteobacteria bacterium]
TVRGQDQQNMRLRGRVTKSGSGLTYGYLFNPWKFSDGLFMLKLIVVLKIFHFCFSGILE